MRAFRLLLPLLLGLMACGGETEAVFQTVEGCGPVRSVAADDKSHVAAGAPLDYETDPPAAGAHYGTWADTGIHPEPVADGFLVHNLEHGHVVVWHRDLTGEQLAAIAATVDPAWLLVVPRPTLDGALAMAAWGKLQICDTLPADPAAAVRAFARAYRDRAPESIPGSPRTTTA